MDGEVPAGAEADRESRRDGEFADRITVVDDVALKCRGCGETYVGTTLKGIVDKSAPGHLPLGHCPDCAKQYDADMVAFGKTYHGSRVRSQVEDVEMPTMSEDVQHQLGLDQERDDDRYWE